MLEYEIADHRAGTAKEPRFRVDTHKRIYFTYVAEGHIDAVTSIPKDPAEHIRKP